MNERLIHDTAERLARVTLALVEHRIRPEERKDAFDSFYAVAKEEVARYETARLHKQLRPAPSDN